MTLTEEAVGGQSSGFGDRRRDHTVGAANSAGGMATEGVGDLRPASAGTVSVGRDIVRVALLVLAAVALSLAAQLVVVSNLQHRASQQAAFDKLRKQLDEGVAPVGPTDRTGRLLVPGTPVALLEIPSLGVHQVVFEGTTSGVLRLGPGHRRGTPLPGQPGTSAIYGRQASYGGPFRGLHVLHRGAKITVTTQEGISAFRVIDIRRAGDLAPQPLASGAGRLLLVTADGQPFFPSGVLRVDADLTSQTLAPSSSTAITITSAEQIMAVDSSTVWALVLWLQALLIVAVAVVWSWNRWGHQQTWIVFLPVTALVAFLASDQFLKLLPNLL